MRYLRSFLGLLSASLLLAAPGAQGQGFLVFQNWYIQGAPNAAYFEGFGIHCAGMIYQNTLGSPAIESKTRTAANNAVNQYYNNIVMLDYEYQLFPDPRIVGDDSSHHIYERMCQVGRWFKSQQPTIKMGFFDYICLGPTGTVKSFWAGDRDTTGHTAAWHAADDKIAFFADSVDYLAPGIYPWYQDTTEFCAYARAVVAETKRIAHGKPVYPIISPQAFSVGNLTLGVPVGHDYFARMLKVVKDAGADGVIIWASTLEGPNNYQWDANAGWWAALKEFMASLDVGNVSIPNIPTLIAPPEGATTQPPSSVLQWSRSSGAKYYHIQVADNITFQNPLINDSTITDSLRQVTSLKSKTPYYWRVQAKSASSWSRYSTIANFLTAAVVPTESPLNQNLPTTFSLSQNFPNPFNPSTTIRFGLPAPSHVSMTIYNTQGQVVLQLLNGEREAGFYEVSLDSSRLASGVYFYRFQAGNFVATKKLILLK
jgi:hypothetical protein